MTLIKTIPVSQANGLLQKIYSAQQEKLGYVPNHSQVFSLNPEAYEAWQKLIDSVRSKMRLRRYELVTFAAAQAQHCTY
jgi:hypothetical protein